MSIKKLNDIKNDDRRKITEEIDTKSIPIAGDSWDEENRLKSCPDYGICSDCTNAIIIKRKYGGWRGKCNAYDLEHWLNEVDRVEECTRYSKRGAMSLNDMYSIAYLIEIDDKKIGLV